MRKLFRALSFFSRLNWEAVVNKYICAFERKRSVYAHCLDANFLVLVACRQQSCTLIDSPLEVNRVQKRSLVLLIIRIANFVLSKRLLSWYNKCLFTDSCYKHPIFSILKWKSSSFEEVWVKIKCYKNRITKLHITIATCRQWSAFVFVFWGARLCDYRNLAEKDTDNRLVSSRNRKPLATS